MVQVKNLFWMPGSTENGESSMFENTAVDAELIRSLGLTIKEIEPILAVGGDLAEKQFMECCRCLWKADGIELVEPFIEAAFNILPAKSRTVLFERMLTIVYVAQDSEIHTKLGDTNEQALIDLSRQLKQ
jgi:hypothetical protein